MPEKALMNWCKTCFAGQGKGKGSIERIRRWTYRGRNGFGKCPKKCHCNGSKHLFTYCHWSMSGIHKIFMFIGNLYQSMLNETSRLVSILQQQLLVFLSLYACKESTRPGTMTPWDQRTNVLLWPTSSCHLFSSHVQLTAE